MPGRLARLFFLAFVALVAMASTATGADAAAIGKTSIADRPAARQASLRGACASDLALNAPAGAQESAMSCLVNEARGRYGLPALAPSAPLTESALAKGRDLVRCNEFSHTACGREFSFWIGESGYMAADCWRVGENLAWGVDEEGTVGSIFRAWMHSPAHRANILGNFEATGLDLRVGQLGGLNNVHIWTQHFGSHCST